MLKSKNLINSPICSSVTGDAAVAVRVVPAVSRLQSSRGMEESSSSKLL